MAIETSPRKGKESFPLGPSTATTVRPSAFDWLTLTPAGIVTGCLPILDTCSPDLAEDLAADPQLLRLAVGHHAPRRRDHRHPHAVEDLRQVGGLPVDPPPGLRRPLDR